MSQIKVPLNPVIIKKGATISALKNNTSKRLVVRCLKIRPVFKEEVVCKVTSELPDLQRDFPDLSIINRLNTVKGTRTTIAKYKSDGSVIERTSKEVITAIGQENYDKVLSALLSIKDQEVAVRAILALLTAEKEKNTVKKVNALCQTDESSGKLLMSLKERSKRIKRQFSKPYVVHYSKDAADLKRVVIDPKDVLNPNSKIDILKTNSGNGGNSKSLKLEQGKSTESGKDANEPFPELNEIIDEDSNFTVASLGNVSLTSQLSVNIPQVLENPYSLLSNIEQHTEQNIDISNPVPLHLNDGSIIMVCMKPMDKFHWATPEILWNLPQEQKTKLMYQQACVDWQCCVEMDDDGYLPIHQAVMSNDLDFLKRQCSVLRAKHGSVDIPSRCNMTALQMSINKDGEACTSLLLQYGADPLQQDEEGKSFFHTAAEVSREHLDITLEHCRRKARQILKQDEDLWNPDMDNQSDEELAKFLLDTICLTVDNAGYTPLMLASKQGNYESTKLLVDASPDTINRPMPNSGNTALYLAVGAAYMEAYESTNHSKVPEHYMKTIEILVENGADPNVENHAGNTVTMLLAEINMVDLSILIANNLSSVKYFDEKVFAKNNINSYMLLKSGDGEVNLAKIKPKEEICDKTDVPSIGDDNSKCSNTKTSEKVTNNSLKADKSINSDKLVASDDSTSAYNTMSNKSTVDDVKNKFNSNLDTVNKTNINKSVSKVNATNVNKTASKRTTNTEQTNKAKITQAEIPKFVKILPKPDPRFSGTKHKIDEDIHLENIKKSKNTPAILIKSEPVAKSTETFKSSSATQTPKVLLKVPKGALKQIDTVKIKVSKSNSSGITSKVKKERSQTMIVQNQEILRQLLMNKKRDEIESDPD